VRSFDSRFDNSVPPAGSGLPPVGVESVDLITAVNGQPVTTLGSYNNAVAASGAGSMVTLDILRVAHPAGQAPTTTALQVDVPVLDLLPPVAAGGADLLDAIWSERRHELAMEQHRWFDLIRQDRAAEVMHALTC